MAELSLQSLWGMLRASPPRDQPPPMSLSGLAAEPDWSRYNQPFGEIRGTSPEDTPTVFQTRNGVRITEGDIQRGMDVGMGAATVGGPTKGIKAYHGSPHDVDVLKPGTSGNYGPATYFHIDPADAERYRPQGGKVYEANLNVQRPFDMDKPVSAEDASAILRAFGNDKMADSVAASGKGYWSGNEFWHWGMGQGVDPAKKSAALQSAGFDSVIGDPGKAMTGKSTRSPEVAVFNDKLIDIMRKYGIAGLAPLAGAGALQQQPQQEVY